MVWKQDGGRTCAGLEQVIKREKRLANVAPMLLEAPIYLLPGDRSRMFSSQQLTHKQSRGLAGRRYTKQQRQADRSVSRYQEATAPPPTRAPKSPALPDV
jgi:hypothetical protein